MDDSAVEARWAKLTLLLEPIHANAVTTARRLCRSGADGDDLYQETVLTAFEKFGSLRNESSFRSWFFAVLLSRHRSRARRAFWRRFTSLEVELAGGRDPGVASDSHLVLSNDRITRALAALPAVQREAIVLFEMDGFSIEEITGLQRVSLSAVKSRLVRGRQALRSYYERRGWVQRAEGAPVSEGGLA